MISHVCACLLAHGEKRPYFVHFLSYVKWAYSLSVCPIGCTPSIFVFMAIRVLSHCKMVVRLV